MRVSVGFSLAAALLAACGFASATPTGLQSDVVFTTQRGALARRLIPPASAI